MRGLALSIDIGSTYTKGALFSVGDGTLDLLRREAAPTTQERLGAGFGRVLAGLLGKLYTGRLEDLASDVPVRFSSSAKGGLRIAAVGIVPDLTLQVARLAAWSAGGRIVGDSAYRLTPAALKDILAKDPDIILLTGGTDGGNERFVLTNAELIGGSDFSGTLLYAGNAAAREEVGRMLAGKNLVMTDNVMPEIGTIRIEPARRKIQEIFLDTIVRGRGLGEVRSFCGADPKPTPLGVFDLVSRIGDLHESWRDFCTADLGGATTDFYSYGEAFQGREGILLKGIKEPRVKRTVEGDLGLRVSARSLLSSGREYLEAAAEKRELPFSALADYAERVNVDLDHRPETEEEEIFDSLLAEAAVTLSALRHAGRWEESYTPGGRIFLQSGKDLRGCKGFVGTGGYLSRRGFGEVLRRAFTEAARTGGNESIPLLPENFRYYRDELYLFPLLGNLVEDYPQEAVSCALKNLTEETIMRTAKE